MESSTRRQLLAALAGSTASLAGCTAVLDGSEPSGAGTEALQALPDAVTFEEVTDDLEWPVGFADASGAEYAYVVEQPGRVVAVDDGGRREEPALDLTDEVTQDGEMGMLGIALHPEFPSEPRAFVRYSAPTRPGTPDDYSHTFVLAEFAVSEDGRLERESERTILEIPEPQSNHNAGDLAFGPDGLLYVPAGDGGSGDDRGAGHPEDWYDPAPGGNGQDVTEHLLGGVLRIDVDTEPTEHPRTDADAPASPDGDGGYAIPDDNPLVGREGRDEYYAWGLRNPWQLSFDEAGERDSGGDAAEQDGDAAEQDGDAAGQDGDTPDRDAAATDLYVADVGQVDYEEVNLVERGGNYGWNVKEGRHCFADVNCPDETPDDVRGGEPLRDPIVEYPHGDEAVSGVAVVGGHVYRGDAIPALQGAYCFGDLQPEGRLFATVPPSSDAEGETWPVRTIEIEGASVVLLFAFGRGADGELYALGSDTGGGTLWRIR